MNRIVLVLIMMIGMMGPVLGESSPLFVIKASEEYSNRTFAHPSVSSEPVYRFVDPSVKHVVVRSQEISLEEDVKPVHQFRKYYPVFWGLVNTMTIINLIWE